MKNPENYTYRKNSKIGAPKIITVIVLKME